jgi:hypothetical protein
MAGSRADLAITQVAALSPPDLRHSPHQFMNIRIILLIVKPIIPRHMFNLNGLW